MGLDSVELVMEFEKYFNIAIPDKEAEKADTVQKIVDCIAVLKGITDDGKEMQQNIFEKIKTVLLDNKICVADFEINSSIVNLLPAEDLVWNFFEEKLELNIPKPYVNTSNHYIFSKIQKTLSTSLSVVYSETTFAYLTDAILACNFRELINPNLITTKYEIYVIVSGITVEKIGVEYYEIAPEKSFTNDLGVD